MTLQVRSDNFDQDFYQSVAVNTITVGGQWQKIEAVGTAPRDLGGSFRILLRGTGTAWVDDASLKDVTAIAGSGFNPPSVAVPADYFGMHLFCRGCSGGTWPTVPTGTWRMHDSGVGWRNLESGNGEWNFKMMDYLVKSATDKEVDVLYTLGDTPRWAAADPDAAGPYGPGSGSRPARLADWRDYVRTVATRGSERVCGLHDPGGEASLWHPSPA